MNNLPNICYSLLPSTNEVIVIKKGEMGYCPQREDVEPYAPENKDFLNEKLGVTKAQEQAMLHGSMFGWDLPVANPDNYDEDGNYIK